MDFVKARLNENSTVFGVIGGLAGIAALFIPPTSPWHNVVVAIPAIVGVTGVVTPDRGARG